MVARGGVSYVDGMRLSLRRTKVWSTGVTLSALEFGENPSVVGKNGDDVVVLHYEPKSELAP
ncbi:MAG: hypothetical protein QXU65_06700 [Sulfolobales archaeon]